MVQTILIKIIAYLIIAKYLAAKYLECIKKNGIIHRKISDQEQERRYQEAVLLYEKSIRGEDHRVENMIHVLDSDGLPKNIPIRRSFTSTGKKKVKIHSNVDAVFKIRIYNTEDGNGDILCRFRFYKGLSYDMTEYEYCNLMTDESFSKMVNNGDFTKVN